MPQPYEYLVVGSGFSGAVLARELAERLHARVLVIDERKHVAGNCHTERDSATGILVHRYGPHIFHTDREDVWAYIQRFGSFRPFTNRVRAVTRSGLYPFPINLHTINQFFRRKLTPAEAPAFLAAKAGFKTGTPSNFEEQALATIGRELYEEFFYGYTRKQWGCEPCELPPSVFKRVPIRFDYNDNYYTTRFQGIPEKGYTSVIEQILDYPLIEVALETSFTQAQWNESRHTFYTGPIDRFFDFRLGRLGYRTVSFEAESLRGDYQGNAVVNYTELGVPHTRIHEHKHFAPWEEHSETLIFREYSRETGISDAPFYPKRLRQDLSLLSRYQALAELTPKVSFIGRLGSYRYLNMDQTIAEAIDFAASSVTRLQKGFSPLPCIGSPGAH